MKRFAIAILTFLASLQAWSATSYQGLWWNSPANSQSGWGINLVHQGDKIFATWFTYDADGKGLWLVMPDLELAAAGTGMYDGYMMYGMMYGGSNAGPSTTYSGTVYKTSGPAFGQTFDATKVAATAYGIATIQFYGPSDGMLSFVSADYKTSLTYPITKQVFASLPTCEVGGAVGSSPNYSDLWWNEKESGWGVNIAHQGDTIFATWFTYDSTGRDAWYVMSNGAHAAGTQSWSGDVYSTTGPSYDSEWDQKKVAVKTAGNASFSFSDANHGTFTATVNGITLSKQVTRQVFGNPTTACR